MIWIKQTGAVQENGKKFDVSLKPLFVDRKTLGLKLLLEGDKTEVTVFGTARPWQKDTGWAIKWLTAYRMKSAVAC